MPNSNPIKVLFLDDDAFIRKIYEDRLKAAGFDVTIASSGTSAIQTAQETVFDVIIVDMVMPDMNGVDVIKSIRAMANQAKTKIVVFSALGQDSVIAEAKSAGADEFLVKDKILPGDLVQKINEVVSIKK